MAELLKSTSMESFTNMPPSPLGQFGALPEEVRRMIWKELIPLPPSSPDDTDPKPSEQEPKPKPPRRFSIMCTSKALNEELCQELYSAGPHLVFVPFQHFFRLKNQDFPVTSVLEQTFKDIPWERFDILYFILQAPWKFQYQEKVALIRSIIQELVQLLLPARELPVITFTIGDIACQERSSWFEDDKPQKTFDTDAAPGSGIALDYEPNDINQILGTIRYLPNLSSAVFYFSASWKPLILELGWQKAIETLAPLQDFTGTRPKPIQFMFSKKQSIPHPHMLVIELCPRTGSDENKRLVIVQSNENYLTEGERMHGKDWGKGKTKATEEVEQEDAAFTYLIMHRNSMGADLDRGCLVADAKALWPDLEPLMEDQTPVWKAQTQDVEEQESKGLVN